jgi:hypothetical protein
MPVASNTLDLQARSNAGRARKRKPLTQREREAKAARIAAYEARNAALKAGTFKGVCELAAEAKARSEAERQAETDAARKVVVAHMSHPTYGSRLSRFLNGSKAEPVKMANVIIPNWLRTNGITVEHVAPTT